MDQKQMMEQKCQKHQNKNIKYFQIIDILEYQDQSLFYCSQCVEEDLQFKRSNYILISSFVDQGFNCIMKQWPPVNDYNIITKLIEQITKNNKEVSIRKQITNYFTILKNELQCRIEAIEKKILDELLQIPLENYQIIEQYQEISKISELRTIILNSNNQNRDHLEAEGKKLMLELLSKQHENTQSLQKLLIQSTQKYSLVNFEFPNAIKQQILRLVDEINFFDSKEDREIVDKNNQPQIEYNNALKNVDKIMEILSNKSNYCSNLFLNSFKKSMQTIEPLLNMIPFNNILEENKQPIIFSQLTTSQLEFIRKCSEHFTLMNNNQEYLDGIKNSQKFQEMRQIMNNKAFFINNQFQEQFEMFLIEVYPFLQKLDFSNLRKNKDLFDSFSDLSQQALRDVVQLVNKKKEIESKITYRKSQTKYFQCLLKKSLHKIYYEGELDRILRKYPIFDLLNRQKSQYLSGFELMTTNLSEGKKYLIIERNIRDEQEIYIKESNGYFVSCVSNIILERDKKYLFRMEIQGLDEEIKETKIGLIQSYHINTTYGQEENLSFYLRIQANRITKAYNYGIDKQIRGGDFSLLNESIIEMRVSINEELLEIVDFPNYEYKFTLSDEHKSKLKTFSDLRLFINVGFLNMKVILKSAQIVNGFNG